MGELDVGRNDMTDFKAIRKHIITELPLKKRWSINNTHLDFDFSRALSPLRALGTEDFIGSIIDPQWRRLHVFGEENYADAGGAQSLLAIHRESGKIFAFDVEREDEQMFLLNSDAASFIRTFLTLNKFMFEESVQNAQIEECLRAIDPSAFDKSEWRLLTEFLLNDKPNK